SGAGVRILPELSPRSVFRRMGWRGCGSRRCSEPTKRVDARKRTLLPPRVTMRVAAMGPGRARGLKQEQIVLGVTALLVVVFSSTVSGFLTTDNLLTLVRNVSTLGIL